MKPSNSRYGDRHLDLSRLSDTLSVPQTSPSPTEGIPLQPPIQPQVSSDFPSKLQVDPLIGLPAAPFEPPDVNRHDRVLSDTAAALPEFSPSVGGASSDFIDFDPKRPAQEMPDSEVPNPEVPNSEVPKPKVPKPKVPDSAPPILEASAKPSPEVLLNSSQFNSSQFSSSQSNGQSNSFFTQSLGGQVMSSSLALTSDSWPSGPIEPEPMTDVVDIYLQQAEAYCEEKQWEKALSACQEILKVAPSNALAYKFLGKILQQQGRTTDAMGFYAKALTLQPDFPEVYSNLGSLYAKKGQWETAVDYYKKAIEKDPTFAVAYLNLAKVWKKLGHSDSEMNCLATAFRLQPDLGSARDYYRLGQALEAAQNPEAALDFYQRATEQDAEMVEAYQRMADLLENRGDWQGAAVCYRKVLALGSTATSNAATAGTAVNHSGQVQPQAASELSLSLADQQRVQKLVARSSNKKLITPPAQLPAAPSHHPQASSPQLPPTQLPPTQLPPTQLPPTSTHSMAEDASVRALPPSASPSASPSGPPSGELLTQQAQRYAQAQDWPRAIDCIQQAIAQAPRSAPLYRNLAKLLERNQAQQQAAEAWYRSFLLDPAWPSAAQFLALGKTLSRYGNVTAATRCFKQVIQTEPSFAPAYEALAQLLRAQGNSAAAEAVLRQQPSSQLSQPQPQETPQFQRLTESPPGNLSGNLSGQMPSQMTSQMPTDALTIAQIKAKSQAMHQRGDELQAQGRLKEALEHYQQAVNLLRTGGAQQPDLNSAIAEAQSRSLEAHKQGDAMRELGKFSEAIAYYQEAIRLNANFSWSHHSLGDCHKQLGEYVSAASAYRQAIALNPSFVWSYYSLGETLEHLEEWSESAQAYRQAQHIEPANEQVPPRLESVLQQLLKGAPRDIDCYQELAEQYLVQGKTGDAIATYQMALQIRPDAQTVARSLSQALAEVDPDLSHALLDRSDRKIITARDVRSPEALADAAVVSALLEHTHLFDAVYYRATNPELAALDDTALLRHYIEQGSVSGCQPNPLFDDEFYCAQQPDVVIKGLNPLAHYHCFGHKSGHDPHPFFSAAFYHAQHTDVAAARINPLEHYLCYGAKEGRAAFSEEQFSQVLNNKTPAEAQYLQSVLSAETPASKTLHSQTLAPKKLGIYYNSLGNYFITEIADFIADALTESGNEVVRLTEQDTPPADLEGHWVVAPHEFFYLGEGSHWTQKQQWLENVVMVNVEQPQTTWFSKAFHFLRHAKIIFDINVKSAAIMHALGLPAYWLPLGNLPNYAPMTASEQLPDLPSMRSLPAQMREHLPPIDAPLEARPLDLHFIGTLNQRRETFFAESAHWLSQYRCFMHMPPMGVPLLKGQDQALDTEAVVGISRRSQILLNVHRDPLPYFEWHRIVFHGLWQNTLVVTEPCHDIPGLVAGEHFVACALSEMSEKVEWLLRSTEGKVAAERIRSAGHEAIKTQFFGTDIMRKAVAIAETIQRGEVYA